MASELVKVLTESEFETALAGDTPVFVDFWAPWCGPCRMVAPIVEKLAQEYEGRVAFYKLNVDENSELSIKLKVMSIPTLMLFKSGILVERLVGARGQADLAKMLDKHLTA